MNDMLNKEIVKRIIEMRKCKKLTQQELADRLSMNRSTLANWEQGRREIDVENLIKICDICGFDANEVFQELRKYVYKK